MIAKLMEKLFIIQIKMEDWALRIVSINVPQPLHFSFQFLTRLASMFQEEDLLINLRCGLSALRLRIANSVGTMILAISISL